MDIDSSDQSANKEPRVSLFDQPLVFRSLRSLGLPLYMLVLAWYSLIATQPPAPRPADAPAGEFSAMRAREHVRAVASRPHPIGSPANAEVRQVVVRALESLGLEVEVQRAEMIYDYARRPNVTRMATVENVVARLPGRRGGKALALMSHYDSVPSAPGAGDAGSGVAVILETLRALGHRGPLANDVIAVITDGEEAGLLGVQAFVRQHRWAEDVGVVLNFEARGSSGPVFMFEASERNAGLIRAFDQAVPFPLANSLSYEVYRRMPNDTDFSIMKASGLAGLNFGFIDNFYDYHTMGDSVAHLDLGTLQHAGSYALALATHLGDADLPPPARGNATYFNAAGYAFVTYPAGAVYPVAGLALALFAAAVFLGRRRGLFDFETLGLGLLASLILPVLVLLTVTGVFTAIGGGSSGDSALFWALFFQHKTQLLGFLLLALALCLAFYRGLARGLALWEIGVLVAGPLVLLAAGGSLAWGNAVILLAAGALLAVLYRKPCPVWGLSAGALAVWLLMLAGVTWAMPGASYLFAWPLAAAAAAHCWSLTRDVPDADAGRNVAAILAGALPGALWLASFLYFVYLALGVNAPGVAMLLVAHATGLLIPAAVETVKASRGVVPALAALAATVLLTVVAFTSPFDERHRKPNEVFYALNADTGETYWASTDLEPDAFTRQLLGDDPEAGSLGAILPAAEATMWKAPAPAAAVAAPEVEMLASELTGKERTLRFHLRSPRRAEYVNLFFGEEAGIVSARLNGEPVKVTETDHEGWWRWRYYALPPEGVTIEMTVDSAEPVPLKVAEVAYRWPPALAAGLPARPPHMMRRPYSYSDSTVVTRTFLLADDSGVAAGPPRPRPRSETRPSPPL